MLFHRRWVSFLLLISLVLFPFSGVAQESLSSTSFPSQEAPIIDTPPPDESISPENALPALPLEDSPHHSHEVHLLSPLSGKVVVQTMSILASVDSSEDIDFLLIKLEDSPNAESLTIPLEKISGMSNWFAEWDSTKHSNGNYYFSLNYCFVDGDCNSIPFFVKVDNSVNPIEVLTEIESRESVPSPFLSTSPDVSENNDQKVNDETSSGQNLFLVTPSLILAATTFTSVTGETYYSDSPVLLPSGTFNVHQVFLQGPLSELQLSGLRIDSNATVSIISSSSANFSFTLEGALVSSNESIIISSNYSFDKFSLSLPTQSDSYYAGCSSWNTFSNTCSVPWVSFASADGKAAWSSSGDFIRLARILNTSDPVPVSDQNAFDTNLPEKDPVLLPNPPVPADANTIYVPPTETTISRVALSAPQNSTFSIYSEDGALLASAAAFAEVAPGVYHIQIDFLHSAVRSILLQDVIIDENTSILTFTEMISPASISSPSQYGWYSLLFVNPNVLFSSGQILYRASSFIDEYYRCDSWDADSSNCLSSFLPLKTSSDMPSASSDSVIEVGTRILNSGITDVASNLAPAPFIFPIERITQINLVSLPLATSPHAFGFVSIPKTLRVESEIDGFSANDIPTFRILSARENNVPVDVDFDAFLTLPDGSVTPIPSENIRKIQTGAFDVLAFRPRSFQPGLYKITIRPIFSASSSSDVVSNLLNTILPPPALPSEKTHSFYWGLLAINTLHSIYQPGEMVEAEVVVLNRESYGVSNASVELTVQSPSGVISTFSTSTGEILETTAPGIYLARFPVKEEGTHSLFAHATAADIDTTIESTFDVRSNYDFDIYRSTSTKMDPAYQPVDVVLTVLPRTKTPSRVTIREFVPKSFIIDTGSWVTRGDETGNAVTIWEQDPRVTQHDVGDTKVIEWRDVVLDPVSGAILSYKYTLPPSKPWLYLLGPLQVDYATSNSTSDAAQPALPSLADASSFTFNEARSWMIAVDDSNTVVFHFRNGNDYDSGEPRPNVAISDDTFIGTSTEAIYGMHPTLGNNIFGKRTIPGTTTSGNYRAHNWTSPPLAAQTLASGTWTINMWAYQSGLAADLRARTTIWVWADSNDSRAAPIQATPFESGEFSLTPGARITLTTTGAAVTLNRKDKIVTEIDLRGITPASAAFADFNWDGATRDGNTIFANTIELYRQTDVPSITIPTADNNTGISINQDFLVSANVVCNSDFFDCHNTDVNLQWCAGAGCSDWANVTGATTIQLVSGSNPDNNVSIAASATDPSSWVVMATTAGTYELRVSASNEYMDTNTSSGTDRTIVIASQSSPDVNISKIDGFADASPLKVFDFYVDGNLTIDFNIMDADTNGLLIDINYSTSSAPYTGTAIVDDVNLALLPASGAWYCQDTDFTDVTVCGIDWNIFSVPDGNYFIHITATDESMNFDQNTSDQNIGVYSLGPLDVNGFVTVYSSSVSDDVSINSSGDPNIVDVLTIPSGRFIPDHNYLIFVSAALTGSTNATQVGSYLRHGTTNFATSEEIQELPLAANSTWVYSTFVNWQAVAGESISYVVDCSYIAGVTCTVRNASLVAIDLDDLVKNEDWYYNENTILKSAMSDTFGSNVGAFVTFIPDGKSDYLIMGSSQNLINASGNAFIEMQLWDGSAEHALVQRDAEDTLDISVLSLFGVLNDVPSSTYTYSLRFAGSDLHDHNASRIFVLRLDALANHDSNVVDENYLISNILSNRADVNLSLGKDGDVLAFYGAAARHEIGLAGQSAYDFRNYYDDTNLFSSDGNFIRSWSQSTDVEGGDLQFNISSLSLAVPDTSYHSYSTRLISETTDSGSNAHAERMAGVVVFSHRLSGDLNLVFDNPGIDGNSYTQGNQFLVSGRALCEDHNCGVVSTYLQYCAGLNCTNFVDMNSDNGSPLYISAGAIPDMNIDLNVGQYYDANWRVQSTLNGTYELRLYSSGTTSEVNVTSSGQRTVIISSVSNDYSFALYLPSSGCTSGKGNITGGTSCQRAWIESSDTNGSADENQVEPEGQSSVSNIPFFAFDNVSSTFSDLNILLDLNAPLSSYFVLKASPSSAGYSGQCTGLPSSCVVLSTTPSNIGTAPFSDGIQDLNVYFWGDFITAPVGTLDVNVDANSIAP